MKKSALVFLLLLVLGTSGVMADDGIKTEGRKVFVGGFIIPETNGMSCTAGLLFSGFDDRYLVVDFSEDSKQPSFRFWLKKDKIIRFPAPKCERFSFKVIDYDLREDYIIVQDVDPGNRVK